MFDHLIPSSELSYRRAILDRKDRKKNEKSDDVEMVDVCYHISCHRMLNSPPTSKLPGFPLRLAYHTAFHKTPMYLCVVPHMICAITIDVHKWDKAFALRGTVSAQQSAILQTMMI